MNIEGLSIAMSQSSLKTQVGASLLKMTMENNENITNNISQAMEQIAVDPSLGNVIDVRA